MPSIPVRAEDAVFLHAQTASCPQQVGAVVMLDGPGVDLAGLRSSVGVRVSQLPRLRRRLIPARGRWDRAQWTIDEDLDMDRRVIEVTADAGTLTSLEQVVGRYFAEPVDPGEASWQLLLVHADPGGPSAIVVKAHHALGDSFALIAELSGLFDPRPAARDGPADAPERRRPPRTVMLAGLSHALRVVRGLGSMALAAAPGPLGVDGGIASHRREFTAIILDAKTVASRARMLRAGTADLVLAVAAGALGQVMAARGESTAGRTTGPPASCSTCPSGRCRWLSG